MKRLSGLDAGFLYLETPTSFMHVASLIVVDPATYAGPEGPWGFERVRQLFASRLDQAPPFRRRLVEVPLGLHHPLWIEDPDFDLDWHLRHITVPAPGGPAELRRLVADLVAIPLDRTRPLWEAWVIDGIEGGLVGLVTKVHHAAIDGASGEELMVALLDISPDGDAKPEPAAPWVPDRIPTDTEMLGYGLWSLAQQPAMAVRTIRNTVEVALQLRDRFAPTDTPTPSLPLTAPRTILNHTLTPHRCLGLETVSLSLVKAVKNAAGCTVNDVVLALCSGALRAWLAERGDEPDGPLIAMVRVSVRSTDESGTHGNKVSTAFASLATDLDDPVARLGAIHESMATAKEAQELIGADALQNWAEFAAPAVAAQAARMYTSLHLADRHRPLFNVTISNVPGPPFPLYVAGAGVVATNPIGPIFDGAGLNITVMSYLDRLDFGLLGCPELTPDIDALASGIATALDELERALGIDAVSTGTPMDTPAAATADATAEPPAEATVEPQPNGSSNASADVGLHDGA
jgi:diacylglycerol O-acyltransferase